MAIRSLSTRARPTYNLLQSILHSLLFQIQTHSIPKTNHIFPKLSQFHRPNSIQFSSQSLSVSPQQFSKSSSPDHLVNELSRILSDYRSPRHDLDSALTPFVSEINANLVEQVLKRCKNLGFSAHRFFLWAQKIPGFSHSEEAYHILVDVLGSSRQFPLLWDFLVEIKRDESFQVTQHIFCVIFRAYSRADLPADAIRAFNKMADFGIKPSVDDLDQLLFTLCKKKHVRQAHDFFDRVKADITPTVKTYSILIRGWGEIGDSNNAQKLFDEMLDRGFVVDLLAWNSLLDSLCKAERVNEAYELFQGMRRKGVEPDAYTYSIFIRAACEANDLHSAFWVLDSMRKYDLVPNVFTYNGIIKKLCVNDKVDEAYELLDEMIERKVTPDTWSYNTILAFHCDHNEVNKALRLISRMDQDSCQPDKHTYNMVLKMLIRIGRFDRVENVWDSMEKRGFYPSASTYAVMIHGLCKKKGKVEEACRYLEVMADEGIPPYTTTCELLRNKLVGMGLAEVTDILAEKMERSSSCTIQELSSVMRGNRGHVRLRAEEDWSEESD